MLCCDTGGPTAGLSVYAGATSPRSLSGLADHLSQGGALIHSPFVDGPGGMRLLAAPSQFTNAGELATVQRLLSDARAAHGLTVVDCGTLQRPADQVALSQASHVLWLLPATVSGARRAANTLGAAPPLAAREVLVARCDYSERKTPMRELTELAESRSAQVLLLPHIKDLAESDLEAAMSSAQVALQALAGVLR